jgi:hypothetical protein
MDLEQWGTKEYYKVVFAREKKSYIAFCLNNILGASFTDIQKLEYVQNITDALIEMDGADNA